MLRSRLTLFVIAIIGASAAGIFLSLAFDSRPPSINLVPGGIVDGLTAFEGETLSVEYQLKNDSDMPFEIIDVRTSCGCLGIDIDGQFFGGGPVAITSGGERTVKVKWSTDGRYGLARQAFTIDGKCGGKQVSFERFVEATIIAGSRVYPPNLVFDDVGQEGKLLTFYVGEKGEAYSIHKIETSVKGIECIPTHLSSEVIADLEIPGLRPLFQYEVVLSADCPIDHGSRSFAAFELAGPDGSVEFIRIPIAVTEKLQPVNFFPSSIAVSIGQHGNRKVFVAAKEDTTSSPIVVSCPKFLTAEIRDSTSRGWDLTIEYDVESSALPSTHMIRLLVDSKEYSIPVRVVEAGGY